MLQGCEMQTDDGDEETDESGGERESMEETKLQAERKREFGVYRAKK